MPANLMVKSSDMLRLINTIFDAKKKISTTDSGGVVERSFQRMVEQLEEMGLRMHSPLHESYDEARTDYEANLNTAKGKLIIIDVLKPAVYQLENGKASLIQKAVVIVDAR